MAVDYFFMTKSPRKNVPDVGIELGAACQADTLPIELRRPALTNASPVKLSAKTCYFILNKIRARLYIKYKYCTHFHKLINGFNICKSLHTCVCSNEIQTI